ncbi:4'-phosphopantetheinyl transferase family protein [Maribacter sp. HTCC2170]|uniref:4'-phosphopantetheinyl transferase family protein n=1 Tax=Maribacter sp. (strain HTCC2170 / KCCM 42371) TaxID=313603 RepID=UPI00006B3AD5|nr:4'-phosphopantetheinyl transferase superfamily protein [Maribacter sp. HTCC2170]EAQ99790.1 siderophore (surfactin) biosynthesis regulatory protein [Maribacter sp. HTCC2170]
MPLYKTIQVTPEITVYIWKIEESEEKLADGIRLTDHCQNRLDGMKSEMHRRGFLSIRHLMAEAGYEDKDLYYDANGKPHLHDGNHISITHSHHFTGIIVSTTDEVGIDVEMQREKITRIAYKFTPLEAYEHIKNPNDLVRKFTIVWGCKESLYKIHATQGLSFFRHIYIEDFEFSNTIIEGLIAYEGDTSYYNLQFLEFEGFTCVYAVKK